MGRMVAFLLLALLSLYADGAVLKTGQMAAYQTGDDGTYQAGTTRSYTRDVSGVVNDYATGLVWQDNAMPVGDWGASATYCSTLVLGGYDDWRLPSIAELRTLVDRSRISSAINPAFLSIDSDRYWSSTEVAGSLTDVWGVDFYYGNDDSLGKTSSHYVRCVRGASSSAGTYVRDNATQTVFDSQTNLTWQDNVDVSSQTKTWSDAISYCENLIFAGVDDWRLPNINELFSIADNNRASPAINPVFVNATDFYYWSSTTVGDGTSTHAWGVYFEYGDDGEVAKNLDNSVRCVRSGQIPAPVYIDPNQISASVQITDGWNLIAVPFNTNDEFDISSLVQGMATIGWKFKYITNNGDTYSWDKWEKGTTLKLKNGEGLFIGIPSTLLPRPSDYIQFQGLKTDTLLKFEDKTYLQNKWYLLGFGYEVKMSDVLTHYSNATVWIMENGAYKKLTNTDTIKIGQGFWFKYN